MGGSVPKQYLPLYDRPVIYYSLKAFEDCDAVDDAVLVVASEKDREDCFSDIIKKYGIKKVSDIILGGNERYESVWRGLSFIRQKPPEYVMIHDGARCLIDEATIMRTLFDAKSYGAAVASVPVKDTIKRVDEDGFSEETIDRSALRQMQTPQTFKFSLIYEAYEKLMKETKPPAVTDDAMVFELMSGGKVYLSDGDYDNIKLTTPTDMYVAEAILKKRVKL